VKCSEDTWCKT
jgi:hypothetical protein